MNSVPRRKFLGDVGKGMLIAGLGPALAHELGISTAFAEEGPASLNFGSLQPMVSLLQETPPDKLQPILVDQLRKGQTDHRRLIASAALANAETFGGEDYVGFHTEMALLPAYRMSNRLSGPKQALPVLKVLYRNSERIQEFGAGRKTLRPLETQPSTSPDSSGKSLLEASRSGDVDQAEALFATSVNRSLEEAYNELQALVQDDMNVHRFVLAHRAWGLINLVGKDQAHTLLRQSVRFCVKQDGNRKQPESPLRDHLVQLLDTHKLMERKLGTRQPKDDWIEELSMVIYNAGKMKAVEAVAQAMADGMDLEGVGQAVSLAANQLVLRQGGGRTHGDSMGVHGSDAINAWRNMIRVVNHRNAMLGLLVGTYHTAQYASSNAHKGDPYPHDSHRKSVQNKDAAGLLKETEGAILENNQSQAAAAIHRYSQLGQSPQPVFDLMLKYALSEDGRLHGEKYFQTVTEEFTTMRRAFRWRQLIALARVTASAYGYNRKDEHGFRAPGYEEARRLLEV